MTEETKVSTEQIAFIIAELTKIASEIQSGTKSYVENINVQRQRVYDATNSLKEVSQV